MNSATKVNPATMLLCNFVIIGPGGGCTAWEKEFPNAYVMVADNGGTSHQIGNNPDDQVWVQVVDEEGIPVTHHDDAEAVFVTTVADLPTVLLKAMGIAERHRA